MQWYGVILVSSLTIALFYVATFFFEIFGSVIFKVSYYMVSFLVRLCCYFSE